MKKSVVSNGTNNLRPSIEKSAPTYDINDSPQCKLIINRIQKTESIIDDIFHEAVSNFKGKMKELYDDVKSIANNQRQLDQEALDALKAEPIALNVSGSPTI